MIRLKELKCLPEDDEKTVRAKAASALKCEASGFSGFQIARQSIDARKKPDIFYVYEIHANIKGLDTAEAENKYISRKHIKNADSFTPVKYEFKFESKGPGDRPVIVGFGPAGMFAGLVLARAGFKPIIIERGKCVEDRTKDVENFWNGGALNPESNVSFGEGGAGTFSDGKLNTLVKGAVDIHRFVLETFVEFGADESILYSFKPHIGTDVLKTVVKNIREEIIRCGGEIRFQTKLIGLQIKGGHVTGAKITCGDVTDTVTTNHLLLATGHSARDTFHMLADTGIHMEQKPFAVGVRMEHPQKMINVSQYGPGGENMPAAPYKLTAKASNGKGVYSFCMCPGGYVVNASSEPGKLAVNGMSYSDRGGENANSAIIVTVDSNDFGGDDLFAGVRFQEKLEKKAFELGRGNIPIQCYGDFVENRTTESFGDVTPCEKGKTQMANLRELFPENINEALLSAIPQFGRKIKGFDRPDALMLGVESRTSSPVKVCRDETCQAQLRGLYPCGEGAGYAGGITSAAMDGIRVSEFIAEDILRG